MKVAVLCEFSGTVRDAFIRRGHEAVSCDILPTESPGPHIQGDCLSQDWSGYDLVIAHPPCTYLCSSGLHWNKRVPGRDAKTEQSLAFVQSILGLPVKMICLENPVGCISTRIRKYDQMVQPWMFGHDASKATCFWLKNLPPLSGTKTVPPRGWKTVRFLGDLFDSETEEATCPECGIDFADCECPGPTMDGWQYETVCGVLFARPGEGQGRPVWGNQTANGQNKLGPSADRWAFRSKTYQGIADAMAEQWGGTP